MRHSWNTVWRVDVGWACVDRGQSPLACLLLLLLQHQHSTSHEAVCVWSNASLKWPTSEPVYHYCMCTVSVRAIFSVFGVWLGRTLMKWSTGWPN